MFSISNVINQLLPARDMMPIRAVRLSEPRPALQPVGFNDFLSLDIPAREMLLNPILPERSLAMLYAPRGLGKTLLSLSIGLAVASGAPLLRWSAPRQRRVLYVDGEMPLVSLQERLRAISIGFSDGIPNDGFRILAADQIESGINLGSDEGQRSLNPLLHDVDLLILDNLSTLCTTGSEIASDAWIHHAGTNGRQRGTSRREDALDTVIALRRPDDYSPEQGARVEVHFEKLRNRVDSVGAVPFEMNIETSTAGPQEGIRWCSRDLTPPMLKRATELFAEGLTVREVAATLRISKSEAGRLRLRALADGILSPEDGPELNSQQITVQ